MKREPYLGNPTMTAAVLRSHHISARKRFGQNFLIDDDVLKATVTAAGIGENDFVLEVGPGIGTLTQYLAFAARKVCAVEIDRSLEPVLEDTLSPYPNAKVIWADIMKTDLKELSDLENDGRSMKVAANLPYYITTPVIMKLLEDGDRISGITVMVQKEVADRMEALPGSKDYGALSLAVQYYAKPELVRVVHPSSFVPQPGVDSAVIHLEKYDTPPVSVKDPALMFRLIRASFNQRRKKLANAAANSPELNYGREQIEEALGKCGIRPDARGEALSLQEFAALADELLQ